MTRWSSRWAWVARAAAHDRHLDSQWMADTRHLRRVAAEIQLTAAIAMAQRVRDCLDTTELTARDLAQWLRESVATVELLAGGPTSRTEVTGGTWPPPVTDHRAAYEAGMAALERIVAERREQLQAGDG